MKKLPMQPPENTTSTPATPCAAAYITETTYSGARRALTEAPFVLPPVDSDWDTGSADQQPAMSAIVSMAEAGREKFAKAYIVTQEHRRPFVPALRQRQSQKNLASDANQLAVMASNLVDGLTPQKQFDVATVVAQPYAMLASASLLEFESDEFPAFDRFDLFRRTVHYGSTAHQRIQCYLQANLLIDWFNLKVIDANRYRDGGLMSQFVKIEKSNGLPDGTAAANAFMVFVGGLGLSTGLINAMTTLLSHPDSMIELEEHPYLWPRAVDELMRFAPLLDSIPCLDPNKSENGQQTFKFADLKQANRDRLVFENPAELKFDRPNNPHLSFGVKPRLCGGMNFAKLAMEIALRIMCSRLDNLRSSGEDDTGRPQLIFDRFI